MFSQGAQNARWHFMDRNGERRRGDKGHNHVAVVNAIVNVPLWAGVRETAVAEVYASAGALVQQMVQHNIDFERQIQLSRAKNRRFVKVAECCKTAGPVNLFAYVNFSLMQGFNCVRQCGNIQYFFTNYSAKNCIQVLCHTKHFGCTGTQSNDTHSQFSSCGREVSGLHLHRLCDWWRTQSRQVPAVWRHQARSPRHLLCTTC
jgi:hypothetical protein